MGNSAIGEPTADWAGIHAGAVAALDQLLLAAIAR
jgi:hypothetical protein